ncbi:hypothetical protein GQ53DRAFT_640932 [Thozetella sp. PMI_491]|nr:hypothetical protein GQ53DRAFT_640932 [Thozetella sp. PMI_491]
MALPSPRFPIRQTDGWQGLQDIVTWDEYSIKVRGERIVFFSGEVHPFRLPSPGLWLDVFQKVRAMGFTGVSFYLMWALLEGEPGTVRTEGIFALEEFFNAASEAGIYLLARPGPYINAEVSGGGFPGWIQRNKGAIRTSSPDFIDATKPYLGAIGNILSKAQITNGGPVILVQPENEYTYCSNYTSGADISACLDKEYMASVESQLRDAGVVVPFLSNDAFPVANFVPGSGLGAVDIYGVDDYPFEWGSGCANPTNWLRGSFPLELLNYTQHMQMSPSGPFAITEYQGGQADPWGGTGVDVCYALINHEFARVLNKAIYGVRVSALNFYMIFGGTNWGNLGHPGGYSSYDVGATIKENRELTREKFAEMKLQANFFACSPSYAITTPVDGSFGVYTDTSDVVVTPLVGSPTTYFVVRQADFKSQGSVAYKLRLPTSQGNLTIPLLGGNLCLNGRDSKIHVSDYSVGDINLIYSTAEIFSWRKTSSRTVLMIYGGAGETHEFGLPSSSACPEEESGATVRCEVRGSLVVIQWDVQESRRVLYFDFLEIYLLWRNDAYNHWVLELPEEAPQGLYSSPSRLNSTASSVIVKAGYLVRAATLSDKSLYLTGDVNRTTEVEIIMAPVTPEKLFFNGRELDLISSGRNRVKGTVVYEQPQIAFPDLSTLVWRYTDSLPEIQHDYNDGNWTSCELSYTNNTRGIITPTSLYAGDYGYHSGSLLYRGHFVATGAESRLDLTTQGGMAYGHSVWLNSTFLGSWEGSPAETSHNQSFQLPSALKKDSNYVLTVLIDHMGLRDNWEAEAQGMREPRGIINYAIAGGPGQSSISWKMTGNFGGEQYVDHSRGPLNEGSTFAERHGYHLPGAPRCNGERRTPIQGLSRSGVGFFTTRFKLDIPESYDVPISIVIGNNTNKPTPIRLQLFVNGWQVGKYVSNLGPQYRYVVPEGILNHNGANYLAVTLWALSTDGGGVGSINLEADAVIQSGYRKPALVTAQTYQERNAY